MEFRKVVSIFAMAVMVPLLAGVGCKRSESASGPDDRKSRQGEVAAETDPVCGMAVPSGAAVATRVYQGHTYFFCSDGCAQDFDKDPNRYTAPRSKQHPGP